MSKRKQRKQRTIPMTCIDELCNRAGIQVYDGGGVCKECGGDMYPYEVAGDSFDQQVLEEMRQYSIRHSQPLSQPLSQIKRIPPPNDVFTCPPDLTGCPVALRPTVYITQKMYTQWVFLANSTPTEWIAYLTGAEVEPNKYQITGMYFPKQKVSATHCEAADGSILPNTIATVHSHVGMKVFFSTEDIMHMNHQIEMVVNKAGDLIANGRIKLECGRWHRGDARVEFIQCDEEVGLAAVLEAQMTRDTSRFEVDTKMYERRTV